MQQIVDRARQLANDVVLFNVDDPPTNDTLFWYSNICTEMLVSLVTSCEMEAVELAAGIMLFRACLCNAYSYHWPRGGCEDAYSYDLLNYAATKLRVTCASLGAFSDQ